MTSPAPVTWLLPQELEGLLDPDLRGAIPTEDAAWWVERAQERITDSPASLIPDDPTTTELDALRRAAVAWIEWRLDNGGTTSTGRVQIGHVTLDTQAATPDDQTPLPGDVLSILEAAGLAARPVRAVAW